MFCHAIFTILPRDVNPFCPFCYVTSHILFDDILLLPRDVTEPARCSSTACQTLTVWRPYQLLLYILTDKITSFVRYGITFFPRQNYIKWRQVTALTVRLADHRRREGTSACLMAEKQQIPVSVALVWTWIQSSDLDPIFILFPAIGLDFMYCIQHCFICHPPLCRRMLGLNPGTRSNHLARSHSQTLLWGKFFGGIL
jgi:hypothetical protein